MAVIDCGQATDFNCIYSHEIHYYAVSTVVYFEEVEVVLIPDYVWLITHRKLKLPIFIEVNPVRINARRLPDHHL